MGGNLLRGRSLIEICICDVLATTILVSSFRNKNIICNEFVNLAGLKGSGIQKSVIFGVLAVRYLVLPLVGIAVVKGAMRFGLVHDNPLYEFVLLLQFALPPAMNIGTTRSTSRLTWHSFDI